MNPTFDPCQSLVFWLRWQQSAIGRCSASEKWAPECVEAVIGIGNGEPLSRCDFETITELFEQRSKKQISPLAYEGVVLGLVGLDSTGEKCW